MPLEGEEGEGETDPLEQLRSRFSALEDPRVERTKLHQLLAVITIAICAVICGADDWVEIELFGNSKRAFFEQFLVLANGIPSHDTFNRVFARLDPQQFQECFLEWVQDLMSASGGQIKGVVSIDGKRICGSRAVTVPWVKDQSRLYQHGHKPITWYSGK